MDLYHRCLWVLVVEKRKKVNSLKSVINEYQQLTCFIIKKEIDSPLNLSLFVEQRIKKAN